MIEASAILLIEKSVFTPVKKSRKRRKQMVDEENAVAEPVTVYKKVIDPSLRTYLESPGCRRDVVDRYFSNPPRQIRTSLIAVFDT